jgi:hypothetical protein
MFLTDAELIEWIQESADRASRAASDARADTPIPSCPGWTMADLLGHVAPFYSGWYPWRFPV